MDYTKAFIDREGFDAMVREAERELQAEGQVIHIRYDLDYDSTGDPAVHFRVVLPDASVKRENLLNAMEHVSFVVERKLQPQLHWGVFPYFRYWSKSTQEASREPAWA
jgi:hypothetical protein